MSNRYQFCTKCSIRLTPRKIKWAYEDGRDMTYSNNRPPEKFVTGFMPFCEACHSKYVNNSTEAHR